MRTANESLKAVLNDPEIGANRVIIETRDRTDGCSNPSVEVSPVIRVLSESANRIRVEIRTAQKGWLVVKDTFYPGWTARVNGLKEPIFAANSIFRAVQLGEGMNVVELSYQPLSFRLGAILSFLP